MIIIKVLLPRYYFLCGIKITMLGIDGYLK
jgi:hypothetical protein